MDIIKFISCFIPFKKLRRSFRLYFNSIQIRKVAKSLGKNFYCREFCKVNKKTVIKDNVQLNGLSISGKGPVEIGNNVIIGFDCLIISDNHNYKGKKLPYDTTFIEKETIIEDLVWIGAKSIILSGSHIGEGAIIQAGSVVHGEIPPLAIAGGNPAVVFKYRDKEHYEKLKASKSFYP